MRSTDRSEELEALNPSLSRRLVEDAISAAILLGLCVLIIRAPVRATENASAATSITQTDPPSNNSADSKINSVNKITAQGESIELTD